MSHLDQSAKVWNKPVLSQIYVKVGMSAWSKNIPAVVMVSLHRSAKRVTLIFKRPMKMSYLFSKKIREGATLRSKNKARNYDINRCFKT